jgi:hypothetical protein
MICVSWERTRLACGFRRLAEISSGLRNLPAKVRDREGAIASTRGACAPQEKELRSELELLAWDSAQLEKSN